MSFNKETGYSNDKQPNQQTILLVEDDVSIEPIWRFIINRLGSPFVNLEWVTSEGAAQRAIWKKRSEGQHYDLVISDIFLSGCKTGIDLWRENRSVGTSFIFTSAVSEEKFSKLFAGESDCPKFICKPLDPTRCLSTIRALLSSEDTVPPGEKG